MKQKRLICSSHHLATAVTGSVILDWGEAGTITSIDAQRKRPVCSQFGNAAPCSRTKCVGRPPDFGSHLGRIGLLPRLCMLSAEEFTFTEIFLKREAKGGKKERRLGSPASTCESSRGHVTAAAFRGLRKQEPGRVTRYRNNGELRVRAQSGQLRARRGSGSARLIPNQFIQY